MKDLSTIRKDFPMYQHHPDLVYLDSTATSFKPASVIAAEDAYYTQYSANIFRGVYAISEKATQEYECVREKVAQFINAPRSEEIIFTRNTTESINLVVSTLGNQIIDDGDEVIVTILEHHANFVPWQNICKNKKAKFTVINLNSEGYVDLEALYSSVSEKTKFVAIAHISNVLGTIQPIKEMVKKVKAKNPSCLILVDGAQAAAHMPVDVVDLGCDFYAFSSHKMLGPTGVGILWGKYELLTEMEPYQFGGEMIQMVTQTETTYQKPPHKFEAGTPHIAGVIGLGAAIDYLSDLGMSTIYEHEIYLGQILFERVKNISENVKIVGPQEFKNKIGIAAFLLNTIHAHDVAQFLDTKNICVRSGHHCTMPLHNYLNFSASVRASLHCYNTIADINALCDGLREVEAVFSQKK